MCAEQHRLSSKCESEGSTQPRIYRHATRCQKHKKPEGQPMSLPENIQLNSKTSAQCFA